MTVTITGTGTGPFTLTGSGVTDPVTSATIYTYVVAQNAANATRVGAGPYTYSWACKFNLVSCLWNPQQEGHIFAQVPSIGANAEFRNGSYASSIAKNGGMIQMVTTGALMTGGGIFSSYGGIVAATNSYPGTSTGSVVLRDTICQWGDSIANSGADDYYRVTIGSSGSVGYKINTPPTRFQDVKFSGCTIALQQLSSSAVTLTDNIHSNVTYDLADNSSSAMLTFVGLYSDFGVPKNTLVIGGETSGGIRIIKWRYDLTVSTSAGLLSGAAVTIRDTLGTVNYSGSTSTGVIPQQTLERVRYTGLVNSNYTTPFAGTITNKYPHTVRVRNFGYLPAEIVRQADQHSADSVILPADTGTTGTAAAASAITGVALNSGTTTVTVSSALTVPNVYNYLAYYLSLAANHGVAWFASCNGSTLISTGWNWVLTAPVTGTINSGSGSITVTGAFTSNFVGNVTQATPTSLGAVDVTGNLTYNTNTPISITLNGTNVSGTVSNTGTGLVSISLTSGATVGTFGTNTVQVAASFNLVVGPLVAGSEVTITTAGTNTVLASTASSGTSFVYSHNTARTVDIEIGRAGYEWWSQLGVSAPLATTNVFVSQTPDVFYTP